jgi:peptidoglycan/xylan/chitin deacetylase (PgdA/CDA1 family)
MERRHRAFRSMASRTVVVEFIVVVALVGCTNRDVGDAPPSLSTSAEITVPSTSSASAVSASDVPPIPSPTPTETVVPASTEPVTPGPTTTSSSSTPAPTNRTPTATPVSPTKPSNSVAPALHGRDWERIPTSDRVVALTFDAGANGDAVPSILSTLAAEGIPGTFFLTGRWTTRYGELAREIARQHRVGNHSVSHPNFTELSDEQINSEVRDAAATIQQVTGADPAPLFRFPFGDRDPRTIALVNTAGYIPVRWTVDTLGWKGTTAGITTESIVSRVAKSLSPGEIVLMHVGSNPDDGSTLDADALPAVIASLRGQGYGFVSLDALLATR